MYDAWYAQHNDQCNDTFYSDYEILGLKDDPSSTRLGAIEKLNGDEVLAWLEEPGIINHDDLGGLHLV